MSNTKKTVRISENDLVNLIDNIVAEAGSVKKKEIYLSIGLERQLSLNFAEGSKEEMDFIFFVEAGTDLNGNQSATFGFVLHPQIKIWEGKHGKRKQEKAKRIFEKLKNKNSPKKPITAT